MKEITTPPMYASDHFCVDCGAQLTLVARWVTRETVRGSPSVVAVLTEKRAPPECGRRKPVA
jgi:actin-like ATPase involved in cell morphogenesis